MNKVLPQENLRNTIVPTPTVQIEAYQIREPPTTNDDEQLDGLRKGMMMVKCRKCEETFNTTFTIEDFENLPRDQIEAGTLHLCPNCGDLSLYALKDYFEGSRN